MLLPMPHLAMLIEARTSPGDHRVHLPLFHFSPFFRIREHGVVLLLQALDRILRARHADMRIGRSSSGRIGVERAASLDASALTTILQRYFSCICFREEPFGPSTRPM